MTATRTSIWSRLVSPLARTIGAMAKAAGTKQRHTDLIERLEDRVMLAADLTVTGTFAGATFNAAAPTTLTGSFVLRNTGDATATGFQYRVALSLDDVYGNGDDIVLTLAGGAQPAAVTLAAGATATRNLSDYVIPAGVNPGTYTLFVRTDSANAVVENNENNNLFESSTPSVIFNGPAGSANITATSTFTLTTVNPTQSITIPTTIRNTGGAAASNFTVTWALTTNRTLTGDVFEIGTEVISTSIAATTGTLTISPTFNLPVGIPTGQYYLVVLTDTGFEVSETNEADNNLVSTAVLVNIQRPDLTGAFTITSGVTPVGPGGSVTGRLTVTNTGAAGAGAFLVAFRLRPNAAVNDANDIFVGEVSVAANLTSGNAINGSSSRIIENVQIVLPFTAIPAGYRLVTLVDGEDDIAETSEVNNVSLSAINAVTVPARTTANDPAVGDYVVVGPTASASAVRGGTLSTTLTIANLGLSGLNGTGVRAVLSLDNVLDGGDFVLTQDALGGALAALPAGGFDAGSLFGSVAIAVPGNAPAGQFFLILVADPADDVTENNEGNNTWVSSRAIVTINGAPTATPNVVPTIAFVGGSFARGSTINVPTTVRNVSTTAAAAFSVRYVLSTDNIIGNADDISLGTQSVAAGLAANGLSTFTATLSLPGNITPASYFVAAVADSGAVLVESNEGDNTVLTATASLTVSAPDLRADLVAAVQTVAPGASVRATLTVRNATVVQSPPFVVRLYLSSDVTIGAGDILLQTISVGSGGVGLAGNGASVIQVDVPLPFAALPGTYRLIAEVDPSNAVFETNEGNNTTVTATAPLTVPARNTANDPVGADLVARVTTTAASVTPTGTITATVQVTNQGNAATGAFAGRFFLSSDATASADDVLLGTVNFSALEPGAVTQTATLTVPGFVAAGAYRVLFVADSGSDVAESNEGNNAAATALASITVVRPSVSVIASVPNAAEVNGAVAAVNGRLVFTRTGPLTNALTVNYVRTGTAGAGDFTALPATIVFGAGVASVTVDVVPTTDNLAEVPETVIVTLDRGTGYDLSTAQRAATVTIADNRARVSVSVVDALAAEVVAPAAANTGVFRITRTGPVTSAVSVAFDLTGTAALGGANNYTLSAVPAADLTLILSSGLVTIPAGSAFVDITVTPVDNAASNAARTVILSVQPSVAQAFSIGGGLATSGTVTIADNEPVVSIAATRPAASEAVGNNVATTGLFTVSRVGGDRSQALTVNYTISGTATATLDYTLLTGSVVIPANATSATITVTPASDVITEAGETVIVTLAAAGTYNLGTAAAATVNIADSSPTLSITAIDPLAGETFAPAAANNGAFRLARTGGNLTQAVTVILDLTGTALIGGGNAYNLTAIAGANLTINGPGTTATVTIPAGSAFVDLTLTVNGNSVVDTERTAIVTIPTGASYNLGLAATRTATVRIADNSPTVTIAAIDPAASEIPVGAAASTGAFRVSRVRGDTAAALTVLVDLTGTATAVVLNRDYTISAGALPAGATAVLNGTQVTLTIPAGAAFADLLITPTADSLGERAETVIATVAASASYNRGTVAQQSGTVTIADAAPVISVVASDALAAETTAPAAANNGVFTFTRVGGTLTAPLTVTYSVSGTAVAGTVGSNADFVTLTGSVTFLANQSTATVTVVPINNTTGQGTRTVIVTVGDSTWAASPTQSSATVNIEDNEPRATLTLVQPTLTEGVATDGRVRFTRPTGTTGAFAINFTLGGTASRIDDFTVAGGGVSFDGSGLGTVTIPNGVSFADLLFTSVNDQLAEEQETVIVNLVPVAGPGPGAYGVGTLESTRQATLRITDNEPTVTVVASVPTAREAIGNNVTTNGAFTFTRTGGSLAAALTVTYTIAGTAGAGSDYTTLTGTVVIPANSASVTVPVSVLADSFAEDPETVIVTLAPGGAAAFKLGAAATRTATVTIQDNAPTISVAAIRPVAVETGPTALAQPGTFRFTRTGGNTALAQTVTYQVTGTATSGTDYTALTGTTVIPAGALFVDVSVAPVGDLVSEGAETVIVTVNPSAGYRLGAAATRTSTVTINNANLIDLQFASTTLPQLTTVAYNGTAQAFSGTVSIVNAGSAVTGATLTVRLSANTVFGDADDTVLQTITLPTLANGSNTQAVAFTLGQLASLLPGVRYVGFVVAGPAGPVDINPDNNRGSNRAGGIAPITINTLETTPAGGATVTFAVTDANAAETATGVTTNPASITVTRAGGDLTQRLIVPYFFGTPTLPGATNGSDFTRLGGLAIFEAGQTTATITISPVDDTTAEEREELVVTLGADATYTLSGTTSGSVFIDDNDPASVTVIATDGTGSESDPGVSPITFVFTRTGSTAAALVVNVSYSGTAVAGDFAAGLPATITIPANSSTFTFTRVAVDDALVEGTETLTATIAAGAGYTVGTLSSATGTVEDNDPTLVSITGITPGGEDGTTGTAGAFRVSRTGGDISQALTVTLQVSGDAVAGASAGPGIDYETIATTVVIPAGQLFVDVPVTVFADNEAETIEAIILTLDDGATYDLTANSIALVTITDTTPTDLVVTAPSGGPFTFSGVTTGQTFATDVVVTNQSVFDTGFSWRLFASLDGTLQLGTDILLGQASGQFATGGVGIVTTLAGRSITLPNLAVGTYFLILQIVSNGAEATPADNIIVGTAGQLEVTV